MPKSSKPNRMTTEDVIHEPTSVDVLFGRGRKIQSHEGNRRFRFLVGQYREHYKSYDSRTHKTRLSQLIVTTIQASGLRFLRYDQASKAYIQVDNAVARDKVSHSLRFQPDDVSDDASRPTVNAVAKTKVADATPERREEVENNTAGVTLPSINSGIASHSESTMTAPIVSHPGAEDTILEPTSVDVLCGRSKKIQDHEGNRRLGFVVNLYRGHYERCTVRADKTRILKKIVTIVQKCGGRFLRYHPGSNSYIQVENKFARSMVAQSLRLQLGGVHIQEAADDALVREEVADAASEEFEETIPERPSFQSLLISQQDIFHQLLMNDNGEDEEAQPAIVSPDCPAIS